MTRQSALACSFDDQAAVEAQLEQSDQEIKRICEETENLDLQARLRR